MAIMYERTRLAGGALVLALGLAAPAAADGPYDFGTTPSAAEIAAVDIDITPNGGGLPSGEGTHGRGAEVYAERCAACHGETMEGVKEMGGAALIGGRGSLASDAPKKTVESYWPYATTLFDYIRRAMPFDAPGSLGDDDVYALAAYILGEAGIVGKKAVLNANSLARIHMPNRDGFNPDPRPDVHNYD